MRRLRGVGDHTRERSFAGSGRTVEYDRTKEPISLDCPPQQAAFSQDVPLPNDVIQRSRAHACCQRRLLFQLFFKGVIKKIHIIILP